MKAVITKQAGGPEVLIFGEVATPVAAHDEVLVHIQAIGVNPVDAYTRQATYFGHLPEVLGMDFAGVVVSTGGAVKKFKAGDRVVGLRPSPKESGSYAEYTVARESQLSLLPADISFEVAASLPVAALTAYQVLHYYMSVQQGQRILIHSGAGGVGIFAIQLAKLAGAYVYTTSSPANFDFLRSLGADEVIDYNKKDFSVAKDVDAVLDTMAGETQALSLDLLKAGGILVSILPFPIVHERVSGGSVRAISVYVDPSGTDLDVLLRLIGENKLRTEIQAVLPFADIVQAHALVDTRHTRGKIVLNEVW